MLNTAAAPARTDADVFQDGLAWEIEAPGRICLILQA